MSFHEKNSWNENEVKFRSFFHQSPEMKFSEMIDKKTSPNEGEMKFNEMMDKITTIYWILSSIMNTHIRISWFEFRQWSVRVTGPTLVSDPFITSVWFSPKRNSRSSKTLLLVSWPCLVSLGTIPLVSCGGHTPLDCGWPRTTGLWRQLW